MNIGEKNKRIELQSPTATGNQYGESQNAYSTYATMWASIEPVQGREIENAQQISEKVEFLIKIRFNSAVNNTTHRVKYGNRYFEIHAILNDKEQNEELKIYCSEVR